MSCELNYVVEPSGKTTAKCEGECKSKKAYMITFKPDGKIKDRKECDVVCTLVTRVIFDGPTEATRKFRLHKAKAGDPPEVWPKCVCLIRNDAKEACQYSPEIKTVGGVARIITAGCAGECPSYYQDKDAQTPIATECWMIIDHMDSNQIKCVCVLSA